MSGLDDLTPFALSWLLGSVFALAGFGLLAVSAEVPLRIAFRWKAAPGRRRQRRRPGRLSATSMTGHDHD